MKLKIRIFIFLLSALTLNKAWPVPTRLFGDQIQFATYLFDDVPVFDQRGYIQALVNYPNAVIVSTSAASWEVNLSTILVVNLGDGNLSIGWENNSDFLACQTRKGLKRKVMQIRAAINSMSDLPAADSDDLKNRATWVKSYYLSLP